MGMKPGDGNRVNTMGKSRGLDAQFGNFTMMMDAYVLELGDLDKILGVSWLKDFGKATFDWEEMSISFQCEGKRVVLHESKKEKHSLKS